MKKFSLSMVLAGLVVMAFSAMGLAADAAVLAEGTKVYAFSALGAGLGIGTAALGTGVGMGIAVKGALDGTARNPEVSGKLTVTMLIGLAMIESLAIYALVVSLILLYADPLTAPLKAFLGM